jgi:hypothetical protein
MQLLLNALKMAFKKGGATDTEQMLCFVAIL